MSKGEVLTRFWGGPEDGAERSLPTPLSDLLEIESDPVNERQDGVVTATVKTVYIYCLQSEGRQHVYRYQAHRIEREEVE